MEESIHSYDEIMNDYDGDGNNDKILSTDSSASSRKQVVGRRSSLSTSPTAPADYEPGSSRRRSSLDHQHQRTNRTTKYESGSSRHKRLSSLDTTNYTLRNHHRRSSLGAQPYTANYSSSSNQSRRSSLSGYETPNTPQDKIKSSSSLHRGTYRVPYAQATSDFQHLQQRNNNHNRRSSLGSCNPYSYSQDNRSPSLNRGNHRRSSLDNVQDKTSTSSSSQPPRKSSSSNHYRRSSLDNSSLSHRRTNNRRSSLDIGSSKQPRRSSCSTSSSSGSSSHHGPIPHNESSMSSHQSSIEDLLRQYDDVLGE